MQSNIQSFLFISLGEPQLMITAGPGVMPAGAGYAAAPGAYTNNIGYAPQAPNMPSYQGYSM